MKPRSHLSDYLIATVVVLCSALLLAALGFALTGYRWKKAEHTLNIDFANVAGIHLHSPVRYAGAPAGAVIEVRPLTAEERRRNADPANAVRVTVSLDEGLPPIPRDVVACLGSDTLLSEKFVALDAGTLGAAPLGEGALVQGLASPTFDDLMRHGGEMVGAVQHMLPEVRKELAALLPKVEKLVPKIAALADSGQELANSGKEMAGNAKELVAKLSKVVDTDQADLHKSLEHLPGILQDLDDLLTKVHGVVTANEKELAATLRDVHGVVSTNGKELASTLHDLHVVMQDMRVVTTYAKIITKDLAEKPSRMVWGMKPAEVPTEKEILRSRGPVPLKNTGKPGN